MSRSSRLCQAWRACTGAFDGTGAERGDMNRKTGGENDHGGSAKGARQAITILGAPVEAGASVPGAAMGPAMLRTAGFVNTLRDLGHDVEDRGDLASPPARPSGRPGRQRASVRRCAGLGATAVPRNLCGWRSGRTPIVLGGDHSLAMGSIGGVARHAAEEGRELFALSLDAHSDFNTPLTSPSGNMHGMSLRCCPANRASKACSATSRTASSTQAAAPVRHPVDRFRANGGCCGTGASMSSTCGGWTRWLRRLDPPHHRSGSRPQRPAACEFGRRLSRSDDRAGRRHRGSGRGDLPRGAPGDGASV